MKAKTRLLRFVMVMFMVAFKFDLSVAQQSTKVIFSMSRKDPSKPLVAQDLVSTLVFGLFCSGHLRAR